MKLTSEIVEHDGGWAYRVGGTYSETQITTELANGFSRPEDQKAQQIMAEEIISRL